MSEPCKLLNSMLFWGGDRWQRRFAQELYKRTQFCWLYSHLFAFELSFSCWPLFPSCGKAAPISTQEDEGVVFLRVRSKPGLQKETPCPPLPSTPQISISSSVSLMFPLSLASLFSVHLYRCALIISLFRMYSAGLFYPRQGVVWWEI